MIKNIIVKSKMFMLNLYQETSLILSWRVCLEGPERPWIFKAHQESVPFFSNGINSRKYPPLMVNLLVSLERSVLLININEEIFLACSSSKTLIIFILHLLSRTLLVVMMRSFCLSLFVYVSNWILQFLQINSNS